MNIKNKTGCRISALILAGVLSCGAAMGAMAEEGTAADLDLSRNGSIFITLVDEESVPMPDGKLSLYQIAVLTLDDGNMVYTYTEDFADFSEDLTQEALDTSALLSVKLAEWAEAKTVAPFREAQIQNGEVTFSDLPLGVYLVVQTEKAEGFYLIDSFLVTVPHMEDGIWAYGVDAAPKVEVNLEPESKETEPEETETEELSTESTTDETLPQTGQLNWPIPFLAGGGLLLIVIGGALVLLDRRKKQNHAA